MVAISALISIPATSMGQASIGSHTNDPYSGAVGVTRSLDSYSFGLPRQTSRQDRRNLAQVYVTHVRSGDDGVPIAVSCGNRKLHGKPWIPKCEIDDRIDFTHGPVNPLCLLFRGCTKMYREFGLRKVRELRL